MVDINYFKSIQNSLGIYNETEAKVAEAQLRIRRELRHSINYKKEALRNGINQEIILIPHGQVQYKCEIIAFPNDELYVGDIIFVNDLYWIIVETNTTNPIQTSGVAWLCNHLFRFQNHSSEILEYWGVIDDGSYSLPLAGDTQVKFPNNRVEFYLPYNNDTQYIYIDQRIATGTMYDQVGNNILEVYKIEGKKQTLNTYGKGGHLLVLQAVSEQYNPKRDNITEEICDFISREEDTSTENALFIEIQGRNKLRTGGTNTYSVLTEVAVDFVWELNSNVDGVTMTVKDNVAYVTAEDIEDLVGEILVLSCRNEVDVAKIEIEVI